MYYQQELDDAVAAGAISAEAAASLRGYFETQRSTAIPDEEQFRLITGFNDIFVSIAAAILLFAVGWIGQCDRPDRRPHHRSRRTLANSRPLFVAATAWGLALFFTAKRRMALPSILLLLAFVGGVFAFAGFTPGARRSAPTRSTTTHVMGGIVGAISGAIAAAARLDSLAHFPRSDHGCRGRGGGRGDRRQPAFRGDRPGQ